MNTTVLRTIAALCGCFAVLWVGMAAPLAQQGQTQQDQTRRDVAVLNLEGDDTDPELLATLTSVLRNEAQQHAKFAVVNQSPVNLSEIVVVLGCDTDSPTCLQQAADQLDAQTLIYGRVFVADGVHRIVIEVFDANAGQVERRLERILADTDDPVVAFRKQTAALFEENTAAAQTHLHINSNVEGAEVRIDQTMVGHTPLERTGLPPGTYQVEVSKDGFTTFSGEVDLADAADMQVWARLTQLRQDSAEPVAQADASDDKPAPTPASSADVLVDEEPPRIGSGSGTNWGAWSAIGVGGTALVGSGIMAVMMRSTSNDIKALDGDRHQMSREAYLADRSNLVTEGESYEVAHRVLLGVGLASAIGGTVWLLVQDDDEPATSAQQWDLGVSPQGAWATFNW